MGLLRKKKRLKKKLTHDDKIMIKLVVGLGNPGRQYAKTRHNAGFLFLDDLLDRLGGEWTEQARFLGLTASCQLGPHEVMLLKPQTFMNRSGESVGRFSRYYKMAPEEILVVHDELDLAEGLVRIKQGGGHAGHNGLRDIISHLSGNGFIRLRIGIGRPVAGEPVVDHVLSRMSGQSMGVLNTAFESVFPFLESLVEGKIDFAMNKLHGG